MITNKWRDNDQNDGAYADDETNQNNIHNNLFVLASFSADFVLLGTTISNNNKDNKKKIMNKKDLIIIVALVLITAITTIYVMRMFSTPKAPDKSAEIARVAKLSQTYKQILVDKESIIKSLQNTIEQNNNAVKVIYKEIKIIDTVFAEVPRAKRQAFADSLSNNWFNNLKQK